MYINIYTYIAPPLGSVVPVDVMLLRYTPQQSEFCRFRDSNQVPQAGERAFPIGSEVLKLNL